MVAFFINNELLPIHSFLSSRPLAISLSHSPSLTGASSCFYFLLLPERLSVPLPWTMARLPHTYTGRSSDDDETASSASFRLDSDDAAGVDLQTDVTDVTDSDVPPPTRRRDKGRSRQNRSMQRPSGGKSNKSEKGSPSLSRLAMDSDCSSSGDDVNVDVRHSRSPEQRCSQKKIRKPAALSGAPTRNNNSNTSSSDDDCSGSGFDSDSDTDPDIDSDGELSSDSDDDGYADGTRRNITRMDERWER